MAVDDAGGQVWITESRKECSIPASCNTVKFANVLYSVLFEVLTGSAMFYVEPKSTNHLFLFLNYTYQMVFL
jgi:hypothetical protein